jgi:tellurite resistance protein
MPNTRNTPEYAAFRKLQVYEAALAEAQQQGGISAKERALLNRLRDSLGIAPADAETLELELQA